MRSLRLSFPIIVSALSSSVFCDGNHNHGHQRTGGLLGGGNNDNNNGGGGGGVSSGYGVPSGGYGAPSGGYGAPSGGGGGVSSGYGAPSGGGGGSGYGAPSSGYGGGGGGAPVYVYQQDQGSSNDGGGGLAGGLLAALLPLGALALVGGLGLVTFGALFPATTVVAGGKRRRRSVYDNSTAQEQQLELLQNYMDTFDKMPEMNLHKDMVAKYLECGSGSSHSTDSPSLHGCLQKLNCIQNDKTVNLTDVERQVADIVIDSILTNEFVSKSLKKSIQVAGKKGFGSPGTCHLFKCHHHLLPLPQQYGF